MKPGFVPVATRFHSGIARFDSDLLSIVVANMKHS